MPILKNNQLKVVGWVVTITSLFFLVKILVKADTDIVSLFYEAKSKLGYYWFFSVMLVPVNIGLEILKWRLLIASKQTINLQKAASDVLSGFSANLILPLGFGDGVVRLRRGSYFTQLLPEVMKGRGMSLAVTVSFGLLGLFHSLFSKQIELLGFTFLLVTLIIMLFLISFFFRKRDYAWAWILTLLRYSAFSLQFFILVQLIFPELPFDLLLSGIFWVFLLRSSVPSVFGAVGIRELSFYLYLQPHTPHPEWVVLPSTLLWFINVIIPAVIGLFYIRNIR